MKSFIQIKIHPVDIDLLDIGSSNAINNALRRRAPLPQSKIVVMDTPESRAGVRNIYREYAERDFGFHEKSIDDETLEKLHEIARTTGFMFDTIVADYIGGIKQNVIPKICEVRNLIIEEMKKQQS